MRTAAHGMPRIGPGRSLKWALEGFWSERLSAEELEATASSIRRVELGDDGGGGGRLRSLERLLPLRPRS